MGGGIVTANYHSLSCKLWELGSNDQRGEGTAKRFLSWKWEAAWSWLEGFPCWVGGLVLCPSFLTITQHLHATPWFKAGRSRARSGHLSSPMGQCQGQLCAGTRPAGPKEQCQHSSSQRDFLLLGQERNSSPHSLKR